MDKLIEWVAKKSYELGGRADVFMSTKSDLANIQRTAQAKARQILLDEYERGHFDSSRGWYLPDPLQSELPKREVK